MGRLSGKNCIITGAAGAIGLETSILFAQEGANVLMGDINKEQLDKALQTVAKFAPDAKLASFVCLFLPAGSFASRLAGWLAS
jgi:NAD(P)-dependent dehydrogenase (short-subunit alcohol dehydrogenase family)